MTTKRGRKPNTNRKGYFYENEERAVIEYIEAKTKDEKDFIFETRLKTAFTIMIESIIRRYNLYPPDETFDETFNDTMSFLITKIDKFTAEKGRAYSYLQTICKNDLLSKINKFTINQNRNTPYDEFVTTINEDEEIHNSRIAEDVTEDVFYNELINETISKINILISENEKKTLKDKTRLNENEIKVGRCLLEILTNWEFVFDEVGCDKFNKNSMLTFIKDETGFNTKEIRDAMKKYKFMYYETKEEILG